VVQQRDLSAPEHDCEGEQEFFGLLPCWGSEADEGAECCHLDGLDAIMSSCDASILDEISDQIVKHVARIVKRWWTLHGLPYVIDAFRVEPDVGTSITCCSISKFSVLTFVCLDIGGACKRR
jgi:hypothetical protein